jgi:hypothetical protein
MMNPSVWLSNNLAHVLVAVATAASELSQSARPSAQQSNTSLQEGSQDVGTV